MTSSNSFSSITTVAASTESAATELTIAELEAPHNGPANLLTVLDIRIGAYDFETGLPTADGKDSDVMCVYCRSVPHHPVSNSVCGHFACDICIDKHWRKSNDDGTFTCATCRAIIMPAEFVPFAKMPMSTKFLYEMKLEVLCPNTDGDRKCTQRGTPFKIDEHRVSKCKLRILSCPNFGCAQHFTCDKMLEHFRSCKKWVLGADGKPKFTLRTPGINRFPFAETLSEAIYKIGCSIPIDRGGSDSENEETSETRFAARRMEAHREQRRASGIESPTLHQTSFLALNPQDYLDQSSEASEREDSPVPFPINLNSYRRPTRNQHPLARARSDQSRTTSSSRPQPPPVVNLRANPRRQISSWLTNTNLTATSNLTSPRSRHADSASVSTRWTFSSSSASAGFVLAKYLLVFILQLFFPLYHFSIVF